MPESKKLKCMFIDFHWKVSIPTKFLMLGFNFFVFATCCIFAELNQENVHKSYDAMV